MNILFICSRNKWRSATAEAIYKTHPLHQVRSAGTFASAVTKVSAKLINWADQIFVMEKKHKGVLVEKFPIEMLTKEVVVLDIPDEYGFMDPELIEMIRTSVEPYL